MVRGELPGSKVVSLEEVIAKPSSASAEAWLSEADFVGEANRLSGRTCSMLISHQINEENINT